MASKTIAGESSSGPKHTKHGSRVYHKPKPHPNLSDTPSSAMKSNSGDKRRARVKKHHPNWGS